jgi:hypothetical protein
LNWPRKYGRIIYICLHVHNELLTLEVFSWGRLWRTTLNNNNARTGGWVTSIHPHFWYLTIIINRGVTNVSNLKDTLAKVRGNPRRPTIVYYSYLLTHSPGRLRLANCFSGSFLVHGLEPFFFNTVLSVPMAKNYIIFHSLEQLLWSMMPDIWVSKNKSHIEMVCLTISHVPLGL